MLKYFALLLISFTCVASEPKFHFMDCVNITQGFYGGCKGSVTSFIRGNNSDGPSYIVEVDSCKGKSQSFSDIFDQNDLEACKP